MLATKAGNSRNSAENSALAARLSREIGGDVLFDAFSRGRYATDASFYQIMPAGVVVPRSMDEALRALAICRNEGRIVTPRGGGTSQCGQTINNGLVIDGGVWKHNEVVVTPDPAWPGTDTPVVLGQLCLPAPANRTGFQYRCTRAGRTNLFAEPNWAAHTDLDEPYFVDGTAHWTCFMEEGGSIRTVTGTGAINVFERVYAMESDLRGAHFEAGFGQCGTQGFESRCDGVRRSPRAERLEFGGVLGGIGHSSHPLNRTCATSMAGVCPAGFSQSVLGLIYPLTAATASRSDSNRRKENDQRDCTAPRNQQSHRRHCRREDARGHASDLPPARVSADRRADEAPQLISSPCKFATSPAASGDFVLGLTAFPSAASPIRRG